MTKVCTKCKRELDVLSFYKDKNKKDGLSCHCKDCQKQYRRDNIERILERERNYEKTRQRPTVRPAEYFIDRSSENLKYCVRCHIFKDFSEFNKDKGGKYGLSSWCRQCQTNYDKIRNKTDKRKLQNKQNWQKYGDIYNLRTKEKYYNNINYRISRVFSTNLVQALKDNKSERQWETLIPYTLQKLKEHLESQFTPEMNWDNYGSYWEIDHIIPKGQFIYKTTEDKEFKICWSLANLRPLTITENRSRPKDGSDISEELKNKILNQRI